MGNANCWIAMGSQLLHISCDDDTIGHYRIKVLDGFLHLCTPVNTNERKFEKQFGGREINGQESWLEPNFAIYLIETT